MVCERLVCDKVVYVLVRWRREAGGGGGADPGYRIKNKNSTQSCGEKGVLCLVATILRMRKQSCQ